MSQDTSKPNMALFWGCFMALVTTSFAFTSRLGLLGRFSTDFGLDKGQLGELAGAGIWPFAISIILFSLIIDKIGYRVAMLFSFACFATYLYMAFSAYAAVQGVTGEALAAARASGYKLLYFGSIILALGNGTVEAFINPVVATMFSKDKTKWLNILHAGWPGGLVFGGLATIFLAHKGLDADWRMVVGIVAIPAVIYLLMLLPAKFPVSEREQAGISYKQMLGEFGVIGAAIAFGLIFAQLNQVPQFQSLFFNDYAKWIYTAIVAIAFGIYTQSLGRFFIAFVIMIMFPLATTEIGTDGWIGSLMEEPLKHAGWNAGWVLVYTSAIMMVLRFFAGPIVHALSPIGILICSAILAIGGLFALSKCGNAGLGAIFAAATLYGFGKTFFWPTMLGITAEQSPKGGALTLNAISGIGMLAVGILGFPFIGLVQEKTAVKVLNDKNPAIVAKITDTKSSLFGSYVGISPDKETQFSSESAETAVIKEAKKEGQFNALGTMAFFPMFMLLCYLALFFYFKSKGGYKPVSINANH
jgi:MFS family permease